MTIHLDLSMILAIAAIILAIISFFVDKKHD